MDSDTDFFVQAFWVKCRDIIRPELDEGEEHVRGTHQPHGAAAVVAPLVGQREVGEVEHRCGDGGYQSGWLARYFCM